MGSDTVNKKSGGITAVTWLARWRESRGIPMVHSQQIVGGQVLAFPSQSRNKSRPRRRRNALALAPLTDSPMTLGQVISHLGQGGPAGEHGSEVLQGLHGLYLARDGLSRQEESGFPVPSRALEAKNKRMGRARSPIQFNKDLARRVVAARIAAGYERAEDFARDLGVTYDRYKKWESGRTPIQHEYIPRACELTGKDANYFFGLSSRQSEQERRGTG